MTDDGAPSDLDAACAAELSAIDASGLRRHPPVREPLAGRTVDVDGRALLNLGSNDYLGLAGDARLAAAAADAATRFGTGATGSRLVTGSTTLHRRCEQRLAALKGCDDAVLFSSGYLANLGVITTLVGRGDTVVSDALNHASIIDACRLSGAEVAVYAHRDVDAAEAAVAAARRARPDGRILVVTDSVFSMEGTVAPLAGLLAACRRHDAWLMADEAHATGVLGPGGSGAVAAAGLDGHVDVVMGTCSKALGSVGGFVAGSHALCELLRNRARTYIFDTALPPAAVAATLAALDVLADEPDRGAVACARAATLAAALRADGWTVPDVAAAIVPVVIGTADDVVAVGTALRERGVFAPPIRPPAVPAGTARIRLCPTAVHDEADLAVVVDAFRAAASTTGFTRTPSPVRP